MRRHRPISLLAVLIAALLSTTVGEGRPQPAARPAAVVAGQNGTPGAGFCPGESYTVSFDPGGRSDPLETVSPATQQAVFEAVNSRVNQLQNEERIVRAIAPVVWADDGTLTVDLRLLADSRETVTAILVTPAVLGIFFAATLDAASLDQEILPGTQVPLTVQLPDPVVDNSGLDEAFVTTVDGQPVLRLVLARAGVGWLEYQAEFNSGRTLRLIVDRRVLSEWSLVTPVPTAVDIPIDERVLTATEADILAVALRAGPLPVQEEPSADTATVGTEPSPTVPAAGPEPSPTIPTAEPEPSPPSNQIEVAFLPRPAEAHCIG